MHLLPCLRVQHREGSGFQAVKEFSFLTRRAEWFILDSGDALDVGVHPDAPAGQNLEGNASGNAQGSRKPPGEVAASRRVLPAPIPHLGGVVGVSGPGHVLQIVVILGAGVGVLNHRRQRGSAGHSVHQAAQDFRQVRLLPGGGHVAVSRGPAA